MAAAAQSQNLEDEVTCSICLEYFKNPVIIDCGHNFCQSCISRCWQGINTSFACPQCRATSPERNFRPNRQLGNLVEMLKIHLPSLKPQENVCEKHQQRLQLFCEDDQEPICVVCDRSSDHRAHTVIPVEEAAQDYKKVLQSRLIELKINLEDVKRLTTERIKKRVTLEGEFKNQAMIITRTFEDLERFLEQEKKNILGKMEKHQLEILEKMPFKTTVVEKQNASLKSMIKEIEAKCQQQDVQILKDARGLLNRADNVKVLVLENDYPKGGQSLQLFTTHHGKLEEKIREFKEALTRDLDTTLDTAPPKTEPERSANSGKRRGRYRNPCLRARGTYPANSQRPVPSASDVQHPQDWHSFVRSQMGETVTGPNHASYISENQKACPQPTDLPLELSWRLRRKL